MGQYNEILQYYDGVINLTYTGGTPYNDANSTPRKTEIVFLCDRTAGAGNPTFLKEATDNHTYLFEWRTVYACPGAPMECAVTDETSGKQYDLSRYGGQSHVCDITSVISVLASIPYFDLYF